MESAATLSKRLVKLEELCYDRGQKPGPQDAEPIFTQGEKPGF
jgi:hypothetical protein